jgi:hypothetical protein
VFEYPQPLPGGNAGFATKGRTSLGVQARPFARFRAASSFGFWKKSARPLVCWRSIRSVIRAAFG